MTYIGLAIIGLSLFVFTQSRRIDKTWIVVLAVGLMLMVLGR